MIGVWRRAASFPSSSSLLISPSSFSHPSIPSPFSAFFSSSTSPPPSSSSHQSSNPSSSHTHHSDEFIDDHDSYEFTESPSVSDLRSSHSLTLHSAFDRSSPHFDRLSFLLRAGIGNWANRRGSRLPVMNRLSWLRRQPLFRQRSILYRANRRAIRIPYSLRKTLSELLEKSSFSSTHLEQYKQSNPALHYTATRLHHEYAAIINVLSILKRHYPSYFPPSIMECGSSGVGTWALHKTFPIAARSNEENDEENDDESSDEIEEGSTGARRRVIERHVIHEHDGHLAALSKLLNGDLLELERGEPKGSGYDKYFKYSNPPSVNADTLKYQFHAKPTYHSVLRRSVRSKRNKDDANLMEDSKENQNDDDRRPSVPSGTEPSSLVLCPFFLSRAAKEKRGPLIDELWRRTNDVLIIIDKGDAEGFQAVREARDRLLSKHASHMQGKRLNGLQFHNPPSSDTPPPTPGPNDATVVAPCPHDGPCPLSATASRLEAYKTAKKAALSSGNKAPMQDQWEEKQGMHPFIGRIGTKKTCTFSYKIEQPTLPRLIPDKKIKASGAIINGEYSYVIISRGPVKIPDDKIFSITEILPLPPQLLKDNAIGDAIENAVINKEKLEINEQNDEETDDGVEEDDQNDEENDDNNHNENESSESDIFDDDPAASSSSSRSSLSHLPLFFPGHLFHERVSRILSPPLPGTYVTLDVCTPHGTVERRFARRNRGGAGELEWARKSVWGGLYPYLRTVGVRENKKLRKKQKIKEAIERGEPPRAVKEKREEDDDENDAKDENDNGEETVESHAAKESEKEKSMPSDPNAGRRNPRWLEQILSLKNPKAQQQALEARIKSLKENEVQTGEEEEKVEHRKRTRHYLIELQKTLEDIDQLVDDPKHARQMAAKHLLDDSSIKADPTVAAAFIQRHSQRKLAFDRFREKFYASEGRAKLTAYPKLLDDQLKKDTQKVEDRAAELGIKFGENDDDQKKGKKEKHIKKQNKNDNNNDEEKEKDVEERNEEDNTSKAERDALFQSRLSSSRTTMTPSQASRRSPADILKAAQLSPLKGVKIHIAGKDKPPISTVKLDRMRMKERRKKRKEEERMRKKYRAQPQGHKP